MTIRQNDSIFSVTLQYALLVGAIVVSGQLAASGVSLSALTSAAYQNLASIATLSASVPATRENTLALQFLQKEGDLTLREQELIERERSLGLKYDAMIAQNKRLTLYVLGSVTFLLLLLILLNFYLDIRRDEEDRAGRRLVDTDHHAEFTTRL